MGVIEKRVFNECYKFLMRHLDKRNWDTITTEALAIEKRLNNELASNLIYACVKHLEEKDNIS